MTTIENLLEAAGQLGGLEHDCLEVICQGMWRLLSPGQREEFQKELASLGWPTGDEGGPAGEAGVRQKHWSGRRWLLCGMCGSELYYHRSLTLPLTVDNRLIVWAHQDTSAEEGLRCSTCGQMVAEEGWSDARKLEELLRAGTVKLGETAMGM